MASPVSRLLGDLFGWSSAWSLEKIQMDARPQLGDPEPGGCEGSSCLRGALESPGWNGLPIALTPHRGCGYLDSVTESTLSRLCRKPHFHFP